MEIGSDIFNIVVTVGFLVFVFIVLYLLWLLISANRQKFELERVKGLTIFQVNLPKEVASKDQPAPIKDFREAIGVAEQFFGSLNNLYEHDFEKNLYHLQSQISLEIVAHQGKVGFYFICPREISRVVEQQINSYWPNAQIVKAPVPNIFQIKHGAMVAGELKLQKKFILPLKTYKYLESDPLNALTNSLSKLPVDAGAAIQIVVQPISQDWQRAAGITSKKIQEGRSFYSDKWYLKIFHFLFEILSGVFHGAKSPGTKSTAPEVKTPVQLTPIQEQLLKSIHDKTAKTGLGTTIRMVTTAQTHQEALMSLKNISTAFGQFASPELNGFKLKIGSGEMIRDYILRRISKKKLILNTEELASIFHFPTVHLETPHITWAQAKELEPPTNLPTEGTILGESVYRGEKRAIRIKLDDRRRHIFMIGKTGVGKTTLFSNMFEQDMKEGRGACFIDPLGDAVEDLLGKVPPERVQDVVLFDPADTEFPLGLNLLEWQTADQRDFLIQEAIQIFYKLFDPTQMGIVGPQWEHWFRNAALTIMAQSGGGTLIDVPRIFTDDGFRTKLISNVSDPIVRSFWTKQLAKTADFHKSEMYNYFISKFGRFMTNDLMRNIIGQKKSSFNIRQLMDEGKIILINLSKGKIGEVNSDLLGMILVSKIQMAAFSRADMPEEQRRDFYLYVDEFQNFTTDSFASILSEARKYRLNLAITNQYIAQLVEKIRDAVIGNVGTMISYRIGAGDAEFLVKEFPGAGINDLVNLDKFNTYTKLLIDGTPSKPFSMRGLKSETPSVGEIREEVRQSSRSKFGRERAEIEKEMAAQMEAMVESPPPGANEPLKNS
ncbi:MAG TPA: type IV secretion system DNA-binding domain-containing protein [Patescibacteria group bacterium]|nr:type IV secretion system DNA-binding domain-containing protein [Patescibacteria group bacterium]